MLRSHLVLVILAFLADKPPNLLARVVTLLGGPVPTSVFTGLLGGLIAKSYKRAWQWAKEFMDSRKRGKVSIWNLVQRRRWLRRGNLAVTLLKAVNQGAVEASESGFDEAKLRSYRQPLGKRVSRAVKGIFPFARRPWKARLIWNPLLPKLKTAQRFFVAPPCRVEEFGEAADEGKDGIESIRSWLETAPAKSTTDENTGRIWVFGEGSAGKTVFMHRLFLDLIGATGTTANRKATVPVPMLASAENLGAQAYEIDDPKADTITAFVTDWLGNRKIGIPKDTAREDVLGTLVQAFREALKEGEIVLLLDGVDELQRQERSRFVKNVLGEVKFWVASNRPGPEPVNAHRAVTLYDVWSYDEIAKCLDARFPDPLPGATPDPLVRSRDILKTVIRELIDDHDEAEDASDQEPHWLCQPGNLGRLIGTIARDTITDEHQIRELASSQASVFREIFKHAVIGIGADADLRKIQQRLFELAANESTDTHRTPGEGTPRLETKESGRYHDSIPDEVLKLKEIIHDGVNGPAFRHVAFRDYFIAGRIANEIVDRSYTVENFDELARDELWHSAKRDAVLSWLRSETSEKGKVAARLRSLLRRRDESDGSPIKPAIKPAMRRNLLDLLLRFDRNGGLDHLDLSEIPGSRLDLQRMTIANCRFNNAVLADAEFANATFSACDFGEADMSHADAIGTKFNLCDFGSEGDLATVTGMAIADIEFTTPDGSDLRKTLTDRGAGNERSRYGGSFGKVFAKSQHALLGEGLERLESGPYLDAIENAVRGWSVDEPVYLVDLMAGGSYARITALLEEFSNLHILGVDKDPGPQVTGPRFAWTTVEIGRNAPGGKPGVGLDIQAALANAFGVSARQAHIIIAKKALHELRRSDDPSHDLQPALIALCADSLVRGGRLILFEDVPGPETEEKLDRGMLKAIHVQLESLRNDHLGNPLSGPDEVRLALKPLTYDGSETSQIGFINTWIMLKDWANQNRHEYQNRYFASIAEINGWAKAFFNDCEPRTDHYRINPLMFNELGLQTVLDHIGRKVADGTDRAAVIRIERRQLQRWIAESPRLKVLIDFSARHLANGSPLGRALGAAEEPITLARIDPDLAPLDTGERAWSFNLPCAVLEFEKR